MINTLKHAALLVTAIFMVATPAHSQAPTDAQRNAIRSACRADYQTHCASVPPGGEASLQCLQKNMSSLSSGCQSAVRAVEPAAAPKAETAPAAAPKAGSAPAAAPAAATAKPATAAPAAPKAAASTTASKPTDAQVAAIRSACRSDYQKVCAGVPTGGAPALQCLEKNKAKVSAPCAQAVNAPSGGAAPAAGGTAPAAGGTAAAAPAAAPAVIVLRPMRPREELFVLRSACSGDVRTLCGGVAPGGGRIMQCLATQAGSISPACKEVLTQFAAQ
ncbi:MAG: cysteine rich repeat-containing protein [Bradyrhizobium sp.]|uniref:cysteine rich repeat-containing protein n=1 Tax=Bradyrhizobium sp. TaxID=376 RepID=UPI002718A76A|nr:cysteine rich repeat-containing protein [Bradyrhizobium sp.]MDO8398861.1 cysteine rich repeat-containing protein [Bradyrhizobium sp.]